MVPAPMQEVTKLLLLSVILDDMENLLMQTEEKEEEWLLDMEDLLLEVKESLLQVKKRLEWEAERQMVEPALLLLQQLGLQPTLL